MKVPKASAPDFAPSIYRDRNAIYLEFPPKPGAQPFALRFEFNSGGLHKALQHIPNIADAPGYLSGGSNIPTPEKLLKPKVIRTTERQREAAKVSPAARASAKAITRKMVPK